MNKTEFRHRIERHIKSVYATAPGPQSACCGATQTEHTNPADQIPITQRLDYRIRQIHAQFQGVAPRQASCRCNENTNTQSL
ncbi:hypothetical protein KIPB_013126 [Kipferlia bialata]|uniref:Uncharacterized protein n=1 Tax=Kipferlia bialata TaxID=797122 RepID=A0A391NYC2_9EUKA|nr:hypothetical protein KIPB_013126 [Kipferlia bialata]|eukprot:g13126.t1